MFGQAKCVGHVQIFAGFIVSRMVGVQSTDTVPSSLGRQGEEGGSV